MPQARISPRKIKRIITLHAVQGINKSLTAKIEKVSRNTVKKYVKCYQESDVCYADVFSLADRTLAEAILPRNQGARGKRNESLDDILPQFHDRLTMENVTLKALWEGYKRRDPLGYGYSHFVSYYHRWRTENGLKEVSRNKWRIDCILAEDERVLRKWRYSTDRSKWERAVAILELNQGVPITKISQKIERSHRTIRKWRRRFVEKGIEALDLRRARKQQDGVMERIKLKKERVVKLIHESPQVHDINRTSWSLQTLAQAYQSVYGESISRSTISEYVHSEGYTFKTARKVLTSPDPEYRTKLARITEILSNLRKDEKFFSIDEFGPVAIRMRGGKALCHREQSRTIPQRQKSKGHVICTAALELSTNQVTHFYSQKKNTGEMIKLLETLLDGYSGEKRIFFSWDAASWHASKKLYEKVEEVNDAEYRTTNNTPVVELAPLPSSAQFLNVIESVFSGLAKAVIHNSDYQSVDDCKCAIDRYFAERNQAFRENPKRAGKMIWGEEVVKSVFSEANNCKDRRWR